MVGDVEDDADSVALQGLRHPFELIAGPELRIEDRVIYGVITVRASPAGLEYRREIGMADTQSLQVCGKVLNLTAVGFIVVAQIHVFAEVRLRGYVGMLALLLASLAAGWLLGGPGSGNRKAVTLTTALRNVAVGLVIATGNFAGTPAVTAVLAYGLFEVAGSLLLALCWGRSEAARPPR